MSSANKSILRKLLSKESEWNPKVMVGRAEVAVLPHGALHRLEAMVIPAYRRGVECWYDAWVKTERADPSWRTIKVKTIRLDNLFAGAARKIAFIKCDANYHELAVLRGALATIRASRPAMLIEVSPDPDNPSTTAFETFNLLRGEGYRPYCFDGSTLDARRAGQRSQNYFFLTPEHIQTLRQQSITVAEA